jgi:DNA-binding transcriptional regulator PaaX
MDAISSYLLWNHRATPRRASRAYLDFYRTLAPYADYFVVAEFHQVTSDFGAVMARVNDRFGTAFSEFRHTPESVRECFAAIERDSRLRRGDLDESLVARPSEVRAETARQIRRAISHALTDRALAELHDVYAEYTALSRGPAGVH